MWLSREVKLHRAEGNGHIACSSTRGGMSVAGGHCQESRAERSICHGSCVRTTLRSLPQQRAFPSIGEGKSRWYLTVAVTKLWCLLHEMMIRWQQLEMCSGLKIRPYQLFKDSPGFFTHFLSLRFCDTPFKSLWDAHGVAEAACMDGCVKQEQH